MYKNIVLICLMATTGFTAYGQSILAEANERFSGIKNLEIKGGFCSVQVVGTESSMVEFNGEIRGSRIIQGFAIHHEKNGDHLTVWVESPRSFMGNLNGSLRFSVPKEINLFVKNGSGSVDVMNLQYGGLVVENASGSIKMNNIISNSRLNTASGSIHVEKHEGDIEARSSSGSIKLASVNGNTNAKTASGSININYLRGNLDAESASGSIYVGNAQGALNLKTASGGINGSQVLLMNNSSFRSSSGSISMNLLNNFESMSFELSAASGSLNVNGERRSKSYVKSNNGLMIRASTASGSQSYNFKRGA